MIPFREVFTLAINDEKGDKMANHDCLIELFSKRLKALRTQLKISQRGFEESSGISRITLQRWEKGDNFPRDGSFHILCNYFKLSPLDFLGLTEWEYFERILGDLGIFERLKEEKTVLKRLFSEARSLGFSFDDHAPLLLAVLNNGDQSFTLEEYGRMDRFAKINNLSFAAFNKKSFEESIFYRKVVLDFLEFEMHEVFLDEK